MKRLAIAAFFAAACAVAPAEKATAQGCATCTKTAAGAGEATGRGLNRGIIYLAMLPLGIIGTLGAVWYRSQRRGRA